MRPPSEHSESRSAAELCEEVVSTYIQNCLSTWERHDVAANFFISMGAPLGPNLGGGPEPLLYILLFSIQLLIYLAIIRVFVAISYLNTFLGKV